MPLCLLNLIRFALLIYLACQLITFCISTGASDPCVLQEKCNGILTALLNCVHLNWRILFTNLKLLVIQLIYKNVCTSHLQQIRYHTLWRRRPYSGCDLYSVNGYNMINTRRSPCHHWHLSICPSRQQGLYPQLEKSVSIIVLLEATYRFTSMSVANRLPARRFLRCIIIRKSLGHVLPAGLSLDTALRLTDYEPPFL
jgi:hypothetical protein